MPKSSTGGADFDASTLNKRHRLRVRWHRLRVRRLARARDDVDDVADDLSTITVGGVLFVVGPNVIYEDGLVLSTDLVGAFVEAEADIVGGDYVLVKLEREDLFDLDDRLLDMSPVHIPRGFTKSFIKGEVVEDLAARIDVAHRNLAGHEMLLIEGTGHAGVGAVVGLLNTLARDLGVARNEAQSFIDAYFARYPHTTLQASGTAVGLPDGQMGNSEVGHLTLGAGATIRQDIVSINEAIASGDFFANGALCEAADYAAGAGRPLHLIGLVSDGGVHSHLEHLYAVLRLCRRRGARPLLHMITDGRDTPPHSALDYLPEVERRVHAAGGAIASVMGRYFAMDRDKRWERTELAWRALVLGKGQHAQCAETAVRSAYTAGDSDEFIRPILLPPAVRLAQDHDVELTDCHWLIIDFLRHVITLDGQLLELSPTEFDLLAYLISEFGI